MTRILFFIIGLFFMTIGNVFILLYLNLLTLGYNFIFYVNFITRRFECYYLLIGLIIVLLTIFIKGDKKHELHI